LQELIDAAERVCQEDFGNDFAEEKSGCDKDGNLLGRSGFR